MKIYNNFDIQKKHKKSIILIGNFDGVHLGHRKLFKLANEYKKKLKLKVGVLTFEPMPKMFFNRKIKHFRISNFDQKEKLLIEFNVDFIINKKFDLNFNKVASAMLGNFPLLSKIADEKKHTFISTGMSTLEEIDKVVELFEKKNCQYELMHCNSSYPMRDEDANLNCMKTLKNRYKCRVGYSGHENSLVGVSLLAASLGASSIERHITLDRAMYGSDQSASIEAKNLKDLTKLLRNTNLILGDGIKKITNEEEKIRKKLRIEKN